MKQPDIEYMKRALELAELGRGWTNPNPMVGAVIVKKGRIIGEGFHQKHGQAHAEINALNNATEPVEGATIYVTLEPCSHYGKTPPCAQAILISGIREVIIAMEDPNPLVAGKGIRILQEGGISVHTGILEKEAAQLNEVFLQYIQTKTPFVVMKTAMSLDGKIACHTGDSKWISNEGSRAFVHELRAQLPAIMVGIGTVLADDPSLTCRRESPSRQPIRIIVDSALRIPMDAHVLNDECPHLTWIATVDGKDPEKIQILEERGIPVLQTRSKDGKVDLQHLMELLGQRQIDGLLLEGGGTLNFSALKAGIVNKVVSFIAPVLIGGKDAPTPVEGEGFSSLAEAIALENIQIRRFDDDLMMEGRVKHVYRTD
ncbi:bifunctional diaminohydroxyphosphoribosylaminopyrimidine deaminase/5-amino-6-(5-phosphoribosylamino)uracil reductase RibD [Alkalibacter rhizosphaerae]|uniref:Riboflavin biosynthesis protein RibD n=1 Tax=Alkalibacter rhizosphaerae TaxID=2815577 RepID=A0A974XDB5_9FIRM|nr:bifunctional diaminohydroxyphosphoribosylaminopyrimidine deaminase/5-amino-6-(5-phosphoribosylamino)uracil reductase RibD [Alkalibacter rhizosphaerae]QSX07723.1 bifunctional diaminohydroxyphosphoribosylaminopyrimidine deaminase/5-amino-6-(5-phosphoribosylamino)uracil reductase RibD [Alkalibacter rhizosphaerae]